MTARFEIDKWFPDLSKPQTKTEAARLCFIHKSSVAKAIDSGLLIADKKGFINFKHPKNNMYLHKKLTQVKVYNLKPEQEEFYHRLWNHLVKGQPLSPVDTSLPPDVERQLDKLGTWLDENASTFIPYNWDDIELSEQDEERGEWFWYEIGELDDNEQFVKRAVILRTETEVEIVLNDGAKGLVFKNGELAAICDEEGNRIEPLMMRREME